MRKLFDEPEKIKWDNIEPISIKELKGGASRNYNVDRMPVKEGGDSSGLPPVDNGLIDCISKRIEEEEGKAATEVACKKRILLFRAQKDTD